MRLPNVDGRGEEYVWVSYRRLERLPSWGRFAWVEVTDPMILLAMRKPPSRLPSVRMEWHDSRVFNTASLAETYQRHADRIAALVRIVQGGGSIVPCDLFLGTYWSELRDGNHRARALRWLGCPCFPCHVEGSKTLINKVVFRGRTLDRSDLKSPL